MGMQMPADFEAYPEMVTVPSGIFMLGSLVTETGRADNEGPRRTVRIDYGFELAKFPVTFAEWDAARREDAKLHNPSDEGWGRDRRPVINVSWADAQAFIAFLNRRRGLTDRPDRYRLPSEAEWEYACRAGTTTRYSFGDDESQLEEHAWFSANAADMTNPVGQKRPNAFGLHDMHGNVFEWCEDTWHDSYRVETADGYQLAAPADGSAWTVGGDPQARVLRGGSWYHSGPQVLRSADRFGAAPIRNNYIGFRVARAIA